MKQVVLDASVIVKWLLYDRPEEQNVQQALAIFNAFKAEQITLLQPAHWLAEVSSVVARYRPQLVKIMLGMLYAMQIKVTNDLAVYNKACELSIQLNHHLFDTLYHAVALCSQNTVLITADENYYNKAYRNDCIIKLTDFELQAVGE